MWKVPLRQIYCDSFTSWIKEIIWCFVVIKIFPNTIDLDSDALADLYLEKPMMFFEQYEFIIKRSLGLPRKDIEECI